MVRYSTKTLFSLIGKNHVKHYFKGGYLDFSHHTELKKIYINEIYMKKQYKSSRIKVPIAPY